MVYINLRQNGLCLQGNFVHLSVKAQENAKKFSVCALYERWLFVGALWYPTLIINVVMTKITKMTGFSF